MPGLGFWTSCAAGGPQNRQNVLNAFAGCGPFHALGGTLYREAFWLVADRLGTPRMIVDKSGSLASVRRHDYLPFGEELYGGPPSSPGLGGRTTTQGYMGDSVRQKFTGYEADAETGLNFAEARYQSSGQGRFTSVDPLMASASVVDPQSLNRYSYVQNNPVNFTDPTGMMLSDIGVYQTANPEVARKVERAEDQGVKNWVAGRSTRSTASYSWARAATQETAATKAASFLPAAGSDSTDSTADVAVGDDGQQGDNNLQGYYGDKTIAIFWNPVGHGQSSFGHVSIINLGMSFSWGAPGWLQVGFEGHMDVETPAEFLWRNQTFRSGHGYQINLTRDEQQRLGSWLKGVHGRYALRRENNCAAPLLLGLRALGYDLGGSWRDMTPSAIERLLLNAHRGDGTPLAMGHAIQYPQWK